MDLQIKIIPLNKKLLFGISLKYLWKYVHKKFKLLNKMNVNFQVQRNFKWF